MVEKRAQTSTACPTATAGYSGALQARLLYDPLGRLAETSVDGTSGIRRFLHDGDEIAAEYDGSGAMARRFVWGPGIDEPVIEDAGAATQRQLDAARSGSGPTVFDWLVEIIRNHAEPNGNVQLILD